MRECVANSIFIFDALTEYIYDNTALIKFQHSWYFERCCICLATLHWSIFDLHLLTYIHICALFILTCCDCADHLLHVLNDLLLELPFATSKKRSWHCWQLRDSFVQTSTIRLYGAFCKHHGHRTILYVNWRKLLAQKQYEKQRIKFSQHWWCPNQLEFQFFTIAVLLLQPFCHLRVAPQRCSCFRGSQFWRQKYPK